MNHLPHEIAAAILTNFRSASVEDTPPYCRMAGRSPAFTVAFATPTEQASFDHAVGMPTPAQWDQIRQAQAELTAPADPYENIVDAAHNQAQRKLINDSHALAQDAINYILQNTDSIPTNFLHRIASIGQRGAALMG